MGLARALRRLMMWHTQNQARNRVSSPSGYEAELVMRQVTDESRKFLISLMET